MTLSFYVVTLLSTVNQTEQRGSHFGSQSQEAFKDLIIESRALNQ